MNYDKETIKRLENESKMPFIELVNDMDFDAENGTFNPNYVDYSDRFEP